MTRPPQLSVQLQRAEKRLERAAAIADELRARLAEASVEQAKIKEERQAMAEERRRLARIARAAERELEDERRRRAEAEQRVERLRESVLAAVSP